MWVGLLHYLLFKILFVLEKKFHTTIKIICKIPHVYIYIYIEHILFEHILAIMMGNE